MTAKSINMQAIDALIKGNNLEAQKYFFENAKNNPSHETYNNLGYYLCSQGLQYVNGNFRNAYKLGMQYLKKASNYKNTIVNFLAIATSININLKGHPYDSKFMDLYKEAYTALSEALKICYSDNIEYNCLIYQYLIDRKDINILYRLENLIRTYKNSESICFYLYLLCEHSFYEECLRYIDKYRDFIDYSDCIMLYYFCGKYEEVERIFNIVIKEYLFNEIELSVIIESLFILNHNDKIKLLQNLVEQIESYTSNRNIENVFISQLYRKSKIKQFLYMPAYIVPCCFFGCKNHKTSWGI